MKRSKTIVLGLLCGIACAVAVFAYTQSVRGEADAARAEALARFGGEQLEVCVATRDIAAGEKLGAANTTVKMWVADLLPGDAVRAQSDLEGVQAGSPIYQGEVITSKRYFGGDAALEVPEGLSALSVPAKDVQAVGGAVGARMYVDVYAADATGAVLLAESVLVLSSSASAAGGSSSGSAAWVTLAVEEGSVQEIISASQKMELHLVLPGTQKGKEGA